MTAQDSPIDPLKNQAAGQDTPIEPSASAPAGEASPELIQAAMRIGELETKLAEMQDKTLRALAEAENTRRRGEREREDTAKFSVSGFARDLLAVADNLRRALQAITPEQQAKSPELKTIFVGVEATERELLRALEKNGVKRVEPLDQKFDPNMHEVMFETEVPGKAPGTVIQVFEPGYTIHERLLRPARVGIAKGGEATAHIDTQV